MASTNMVGDIGTVITNGPSATTKANSIAAAGPILDYIGNTNLVKEQLNEAAIALSRLYNVTAAGDANQPILLGCLNSVTGGSPASGSVLTNLATVLASTPAAGTKANCIAAAGPIMDYLGGVGLVLSGLQYTKELVDAAVGSSLYTVTASGDDNTNKALLLGIAQTLA